MTFCCPRRKIVDKRLEAFFDAIDGRVVFEIRPEAQPSCGTLLASEHNLWDVTGYSQHRDYFYFRMSICYVIVVLVEISLATYLEIVHRYKHLSFRTFNPLSSHVPCIYLRMGKQAKTVCRTPISSFRRRPDDC